MEYMKMRPYQIRHAIDTNAPVLFPLGVIEYHAEHLPVGTDTMVACEICRRVEQWHPEVVILPPFYYGAASLAVAAPERNGTIQVDSQKIIPVAEEIFTSLLRIGFRNIHGYIAHQTEEFMQGMPTDLAFRFAGRHAIFNFMEKTVGEGWWGTEKFADYYDGDNNPFAWIQIHRRNLSPEDSALYPGDHAGKLETSEDMVICPECVEMDRLDSSIWFSRPAVDASAAYGDAALEKVARGFEKEIFG